MYYNVSIFILKVPIYLYFIKGKKSVNWHKPTLDGIIALKCLKWHKLNANAIMNRNN